MYLFFNCQIIIFSPTSPTSVFKKKKFPSKILKYQILIGVIYKNHKTPGYKWRKKKIVTTWFLKLIM